MNALRILPLVLVFFLVLTSCDSLDEAEPIPAYLFVDKIDVETRLGEGANTSNITHIWVYANDRFLGGYPLPATIPVLESGTTRLVIDPGVQENGISALPDLYPFYRRLEFDQELVPGSVDTLELTTGYRDNIRFSILEDFSETAHFFNQDLDGDDQTILGVTTQGALQGNSAFARLDTAHSLLISGTNYERDPLDDLPTNRSPVWLEVDYKTEIPVLFGVIAYDAAGNSEVIADFGVNIKPQWNKIYFEMTEILSGPNRTSFQLFVTADFLTLSDPSLREASLWLDNLKLVHFD